MAEITTHLDKSTDQALQELARRNGTTPDYELAMLVNRKLNEIVQFALAPARPSPHPVEE